MIKKIFTSCFIIACSVFIYAYSVVPEQYSTPEQYGDVLIFSQTTGSELYAVDRQTKRDVWVWSSGKRSIRTKPTIVGDIAYIWAGNTTDDSRACAVNCKTGKSIWETPDAGWTFQSATICGDIVLFPVEADYNEVHAFNRKTGKRMWVQDDCKMILSYGQTVLVSREKDTQIAMLDVITGKEYFKTGFTDEKYNEPQGFCSTDGVAVVGGEGGIIALNIPSKKVLWKKSTVGRKWVSSVHKDVLYLLLGWTLTGSDKKSPQMLEMWSLADGKQINQIELNTGSGTYFPPIVFDTVIVVASGGSLIGVDSKTSQELWNIDTGGVYQIEKGIDSVYLGLTGPNLWQVEAKTGKILWSYGKRTEQENPTIPHKNRFLTMLPYITVAIVVVIIAIIILRMKKRHI